MKWNTVRIYMKSGNVIKLKGIKEVEYSCRGNEIVSLTIYKHFVSKFLAGQRLLVSSVDLSQIEAITVE